MTDLIYLDYAATSPVDPRVADKMAEALALDGPWANASSVHGPGVRARELVEESRAAVATVLGAQPDEITFTSGATESDNMALVGLMSRYAHRGNHLITSRTEHKAILDTCKALEQGNVDVTYLDPDEYGVIEPEQVTEAINDQTVAVSIMHVNNETGVVQDVGEIGRRCRDRGVFFHVDAAQAVGHVPVDVVGSCIDLLSATAHKICGPKGVGALYVRSGVALDPLLRGGEQERGLRAGTLVNHQIAGLAESFRLAEDAERLEVERELSERLMEGLLRIEGTRLNGHPSKRSHHIVNVAFLGAEGESLRLALEGLAVSAGSACSAADPDASYVLRSLGLSDMQAQSSLRFSLGRFTTRAEVDRAVALVREQVDWLRHRHPDRPDWCAA